MPALSVLLRESATCRQTCTVATSTRPGPRALLELEGHDVSVQRLESDITARGDTVSDDVAMIPTGRRVPEELVHPLFVATPLVVDLAELDHAAYCASPAVIVAHSAGRWPTTDFSVAEDRALIADHQADHASRRAFAFSLLTPERDAALGCLYVNPLREYLSRADAQGHAVETLREPAGMVSFWVHQEQQKTGLPEAVVAAVSAWLTEDWPLATCWFRALPAERSSVAALDASPLIRVEPELPAETHPYLWYAAR